MPAPTETTAPVTPATATKRKPAFKLIQGATHRPAHLAADRVPVWFAVVEVEGEQKEYAFETFEALQKKLTALQKEQT